MVWWIRQKIHPSWTVGITSGAFVVGVWCSHVFTIHVLVGFVGIPLLISSFIVGSRLMVIVGLVGSLLLGLGYGSASIGDRSVYSQLIGLSTDVMGHVREDPGTTSSGAVSLQLDDIVIADNELPGTILVTTRESASVLRGDIVTLTGELDGSLGSFVATISDAEIVNIERPYPGDIGRRVRDWFADNVRQHVVDPQASLGIGFLTGQKSALPQELAEALRIVGLTHIVVASGYNLTILVRMSRRLFSRVSKYTSALTSSLMIVSFMMVTGLSPSMTRAGLVAGMSLFVWYYGRNFHPLVLLPFTAMITVVMNPSYVWGDLGWQLSFAAFAGVMILSPLMQRYLFGEKEPGVVRQILGETVAAHLATMPIIAINFGLLSNVAIFANLLVVPLVPIAMLLTFIVGLSAILGLTLVAGVVAIPTDWLLSYMVEVARFCSELTWAQSDMSVDAGLWAVYVLGLLIWCLWMWRVTRYNLRQSNIVD